MKVFRKNPHKYKGMQLKQIRDNVLLSITRHFLF